MASPSVRAEPRCRYGAVAQTSRSVGMSIPVKDAPRRLPLSALMVPTFCGLLVPLFVKAVPPWQLPQFFDSKSVLPATPAVVRLPSAFRYGLGANVLNEFT